MNKPALILLSLSVVSMPQAAVLTVTNTNTSGPGCFHWCVKLAEPGDEIRFDPSLDGQPIRLTGPFVLPGWKNLAIEGRGRGKTILEAANKMNPVQVQLLDGTATMSGVTVRHFWGGTFGAVFNEGELTIRDSEFYDNSANLGGGAIRNGGTLTIVDSTISGNFVTNYDIFNGRGGGISNTGTLTIINSTVSNNHAPAYGGGLYHWGERTLTITNSSVTGNSSRFYGGGIDNAGPLLITASTITGNSARWGGNGIANGGNMQVMNSTITYNFTHDILNYSRGTSTVANSILGGCVLWEPSLMSLGHNLDTNNSCGLDQPSDQPDTDPMLGPLQDNGGPTWTQKPRKGSPAIDRGWCDPDTDQRGVPRPLDGNGDLVWICDIGAVELSPKAVTWILPSGDVITLPADGED